MRVRMAQTKHRPAVCPLSSEDWQSFLRLRLCMEHTLLVCGKCRKAGVLWSKIKVPSVSSNKHKNSEAPLTFSVLKIFLIWIKRWSPIWSRTVSLSFAGKHHTPGYKKGDITRMDCSLFCPILFYAKASQPGVGRLQMRKPEVTMLLEEYSRKWYFHTLKRRISALKKKNHTVEPLNK